MSHFLQDVFSGSTGRAVTNVIADANAVQEHGPKPYYPARPILICGCTDDDPTVSAYFSHAVAHAADRLPATKPGCH